MNFKDIIGHDKQIQSLKRAMRSERVAHAYLFCGPEGVGKRQVALAFAKALNCERPEDGDSCGLCRSCEAAGAGAHTGILSFAPDEKGVLRIEQVRELQRTLRYTVEAGRRVCVVDGADSMVRAASSVFLKTLEEPPAGSMIILVSSRPDSLLPTILSRCQRVGFHALSSDALSALLSQRHGLGSDEAREVALLSGGSLSRAEAMAADGALERRVGLLERFGALRADDVKGLLDLAAALSKDESLEEALEFLKVRYRDLVVERAGCGRLMVEAGAGPHPGPGGGSTIDGLLSSYELIERARRSILPPRYANKNLALESLFMGLLGTPGAG